MWNDRRGRQRLKAENEAAIAAGVFGAPFFIVDGEPFWGNDRRPQIERWLRARPTAHISWRCHEEDRQLPGRRSDGARSPPTPSTQARALHGHPGVQFVDIRDVRELEREGVIPGAVHAPRGMLEFWVDPASPYHRDVFAQDKEYVLFCAAGWRSALATKTLMDMGMERVAHVERRLRRLEGGRRARPRPSRPRPQAASRPEPWC